MRRVLAALAALLMIAGGLTVWAARTGRLSSDPSSTDASADPTAGPSDGEKIVIACLPELETACGAISDPSAGFSAELPGTTEQQIKAGSSAAANGWITTALGAERVRRTTQALRDPIPVASTNVVVVTRKADTSAAAACKADLGCLAGAAKVSFPSVKQTGAGLSIATLATVAHAPAGTDPLGIDDLPDGDAVLAALVKATKPLTVNEALVNLSSVRLLDAVVLTEAQVRTSKPADVLTTQTGQRLSLVVLLPKSLSDARAKELATEIHDALTENGFDEPATSASLPNPQIANELASSLR